MYNPFEKYPISANWSAHLRRGSRGGTDYAMAVGTPLRAAHSGTVTVTRYGGTGGYIASLHTTYGIVRYLHCSRFAVTNGKQVVAGEVIAYSGGRRGALGSGASTGPHLHIDIIINSVRRDFPALVKTLVETEEDMSFTDKDRYAIAELRQLMVATAEKDGWDGIYRSLEKIGKSVNVAIEIPTAAAIAHALKTDLVTAIKSLDITSLDADDFASIAKAVNDEEDRRDRARLA